MNHLALIGLAGFLFFLAIGILAIYIALLIMFPAPCRKHGPKHPAPAKGAEKETDLSD